jgi:predicted exporter
MPQRRAPRPSDQPHAPAVLRLVSAIARRPRLALALCLGLALAALGPAARIRINSDLTAVMPAGAPAADDYRTFLRTFGGFEKIFVLVRSPAQRLADPGPLEDAAAALAGELRTSPLVADARSGRTEEDERFFFRYVAPRMPLLLLDAGAGAGGGGAELERRLSPEALHRRVALLRATMSTPAGAALGPL